MRIIILLFILLINVNGYAQDSLKAREHIINLTSKKFWGRGYTKNGLKKTSNFITKYYKSNQLNTLNKNSFFQEFYLPVNTFPSKMRLVINGKPLIAGKEFIVNPESNSINSKGILLRLDSLNYVDSISSFKVHLANKLTWSVSSKLKNHGEVIVNRKLFENVDQIGYQVNIKSRFVKSYKAKNICGLIKGNGRSDSLIVITAHYDHLGGMGSDVYFPGANDNASGVSLLLNLIHYYSLNNPKYNLAFLCFSAEEAGLLGSKHFVANPLFDINKVKILINLDLVGTGDQGITVVNGFEQTLANEKLNRINDMHNYLPAIKLRKNAPNSDHYFFSKNNVPSIFIYTNGGVKAYHDIDDKEITLPLTKYNSLFRLIRDFIDSY